jgi:hypothetical protein
MLGDKAYDSTELREEMNEQWKQASHSKPLQQEATVQLQQASLQATLPHSALEGLQAYRNAI